MSTETQVKVHKVVLMVVDHDELGAEEVAEVLEHNRYPNHCIAPVVMHHETCVVEWNDNHPLNGRWKIGAFSELFGEPGALFSAESARSRRAALEAAARALDAERVEALARVAELDAEVARLHALVDGAPLTVAGLVQTAHEAAKAKGWHEGADPTSPVQVLAWLALLHSEVSEAVEDVRKGLLAETAREDGNGRRR